MWQMADQMGHNVTRETRDYLDRLLQIAVDSIDTQFPRIRKEYRMMSDAERDRFHKAILALKEDTVKDKLGFLFSFLFLSQNQNDHLNISRCNCISHCLKWMQTWM
jgi:hypothetical protein